VKDGYGLHAIVDDDLRTRAYSRQQRSKVARGVGLGDVNHILSRMVIIHRFFRPNGWPEDGVLTATSRTLHKKREGMRHPLILVAA
jgi:hypothetical protein